MLPLLLLLVQYCHGQGNSKYVINFDSPIYPCDENSESFIDASRIEVVRHNESTAYMHGDIVFLQGMGDNSILEIILQKEASGKFEVMFSHDICDFCKELGDETSDYWKYLQYFGLPQHCPFGPGAYKILDFTLNTDDFEVTSQHAGHYECQLNVYKQTGDNCRNDREPLCMMKMDLLVEPE